MKDKIIWNLGLEEIAENTYRVHMPNVYGELPPIQFKDGFAVRWPCNPQFTGFSGIANILKGTEKFRGANFQEVA